MANPNIISTDKLEPWESLNMKVEKLTNSVYSAWGNELTNLLIFASLFSAILTAFAVEAAKAIRIDPGEKTASLLEIVVQQLNNMSNPQANAVMNLQPELANSAITPHAQHIYLLYSVSLTLSLIAVLGGITCFQWLREFSQNVTGVSTSTDIYIQFQRHKSLRQWRVITLLNTLPLLLLVSLFLFFTGFVISQWDSRAYGAIPVTVLVGIAALFVLTTSILPALQTLWLAGYEKDESNIHAPSPESTENHPSADSDSHEPPVHPVLCPYRSPQALLVLSLLHYILRIIPGTLQSKLVPKKDGWTGYDRWWIEKHMTKKSIYPALSWVATEFNQSKDTVVMAYQCLISAFSDTYCEYSEILPGDEAVPDATFWNAFGFSMMTCFEGRFISEKPILIWQTYLGAFSKMWEARKGLNVETSNDIYEILHVKRSDSRALLKTITSTLAHPENVWITDEIAAVAVSYMIDQSDIEVDFMIPVLQELCKRYRNDLTVFFDIDKICIKLGQRLKSEHQCTSLVYIFDDVFPDLNHLGNLGRALQELLVPCDECFIDRWIAEDYLQIIKRLASQRLIANNRSLDKIFLFTPHLIKRSSELQYFISTLGTTLNTVLSVAEEHIQHSPSTSSVLHPSRFHIQHTEPDPNYPDIDLKPVWDLTDNFNRKLKEIWDRYEHIQSSGDTTQSVDTNTGAMSILEIDKGKEKEVITQVSPSLSHEVVLANNSHMPLGAHASGIEIQVLPSMEFYSPPSTPNDETTKEPAQLITQRTPCLMSNQAVSVNANDTSITDHSTIEMQQLTTTFLSSPPLLTHDNITQPVDNKSITITTNPTIKTHSIHSSQSSKNSLKLSLEKEEERHTQQVSGDIESDIL